MSDAVYGLKRAQAEAVGAWNKTTLLEARVEALERRCATLEAQLLVLTNSKRLTPWQTFWNAIQQLHRPR